MSCWGNFGCARAAAGSTGFEVTAATSPSNAIVGTGNTPSGELISRNLLNSAHPGITATEAGVGEATKTRGASAKIDFIRSSIDRRVSSIVAVSVTGSGRSGTDLLL